MKFLQTTSWLQTPRLCFAVIVIAAALSGCNNDDGGSTPPQASNPTQNFSSFVETTFEQPANSTPVDLDTVYLLFDANNDPTAFNALLMM
jgi:hypothetical protein